MDGGETRTAGGRTVSRENDGTNRRRKRNEDKSRRTKRIGRA